MIILLAIALLFFAAGLWFWWMGWRLAPAAAAAITAEREARALKAIADARFDSAQQLLATVRRDRDILLAARQSAVSAQLSAGDQQILEGLRSYYSVQVGCCAEHRYVILVPQDFPLENYFPGAEKGAPH